MIASLRLTRVEMPTLVLALLFLLSGATSLLYEIVWVRLLTLSFGSTAHAVGIVLAVFMGGLSLGSALAARHGARIHNPVRMYGLLEAGIGLYALLSAWLLMRASTLYPEALSLLPAFTGATNVLRALLSIPVLLVPATLMGATLPLLSAHFLRGSGARTDKVVGLLYGINTLGAVGGTLAAGFALIPAIGLQGSLRAGALLSILCAVVAIALGQRRQPAAVPLSNAPSAEAVMTEAVIPEASPLREVSNNTQGIVLASAFLCGAVSMLAEVIWTRLLVNVIGSTTYGFTLVLACFLTGLAAGSALVGSQLWSRRAGPMHLRHLMMLVAGAGVSCLASVWIMGGLPLLMLRGLERFGDSVSLGGVLALSAVPVMLTVLVPTVLFGAAFPLSVALYAEHGSARSVGTLYAVNTLGCIAGSVGGAFVLLPLLGSALSLKAGAVLLLLLSTLGLWRYTDSRMLRSAALIVLLLCVAVPVTLPPRLLDSGVAYYAREEAFALNNPDLEYLYQKEGLNATISVVRSGSGNLMLKTNGKVDASTYYDMDTQLALAYLPLLLHGDARDVFIIGLGSGTTTRAAAEYPGVQRVRTVEIEQAVIDAADFFTVVNHGIHHHTEVIVDDARSTLRTLDMKVDVIISEPSNPWLGSTGNLFTREFFELAQERLQPGGLYGQWVHLYRLRPGDLAMILRTFGEVFEDVTLWRASASDVLVMGRRRGAREGIAYAALSERFSRLKGTAAAEDLSVYLGVSTVEQLLARHITSYRTLAPLFEGVALNTDDLPRLEFSAPFALYLDTLEDNDRMLGAHYEPPALIAEPDSTVVSEIVFEARLLYERMDLSIYRNVNPLLTLDQQRFIALGKAARSGLHAEALQSAADLMRRHPQNVRYAAQYARLMRSSDPAGAASAYEHALQLQKPDFALLLEAAELALEAADMDRARQYLQQARTLPHALSEDGRLRADLASIAYE